MLAILSIFVLSACAPIAVPAASPAGDAESGSAAETVEIRLASYGLGDAWNANLEMPSADWTCDDLLEYAAALTDDETGQCGFTLAR